MTLASMAVSYHHSAGLLKARIAELKARRDGAGPAERSELEQRIRDLSILYRETRSTARTLEHYYDRRNRGHVSRAV